MVLTHAERARLVIRFLMNQTKKTQAELAQELGYGNATVLSQILNGKKAMPKDLPGRIASLDPPNKCRFYYRGIGRNALTAPRRPRNAPYFNANPLGW